MATIPISDGDPKNTYTASAGETSFAYTFWVKDETHLSVYVNGTLKELTTDYTVSAVLDPTGGNIVFGTGLNENDLVSIVSDPPLERTADYVTTIRLTALNEELTYLLAIMQRLDRKINDSVKIGDSSTVTFDTTIPLVTGNGGKTLVINDAVTGFEWQEILGSLNNVDDVTISSVTDNEVLAYDSSTSKWINQTASEAGLAAASHNHAASEVTSGTFADARISESSVTQHEAAIDHDALTNFVANEHIDWTSTTSNLSTSGTAATGALGVTGNITVSGTVDGRDIASDGSTLDTINGSYITASSTNTLTNKSGAISQWTNDSGYTTATGTVTSVAVSGSDGIEVDSGSPVTSSGTIALGINKTTLLSHINVEDGAQVNTVDSVNSATGTVVLDADDIDDTSTTNKFVTASDITVLGNTSGTNTGDQTITLQGDVTGTGTGTFTTTIASGAVDVAMLSATGTPSSSTFYRGDNTWAAPAGGGDMVLADVQIITGAKTFNSAKLILAGSTSGTTIFNAAAVAGTTTITLPATTGTVALTSDINTANVTAALDGASLTAVTVAGTDKVLVQDASDSSNLKTVTAQSIADLGGGGKILQVVSVSKTDSFTMTSTTFADVTGFSASITPSSTSSKILVIVDMNWGTNGNLNQGMAQLLRDSTPISIGTSVGSRTAASLYIETVSSNNCTNGAIHYLDSPATTSATTYKMQVKTNVSGRNTSVNRSQTDNDLIDRARTASNITLMEIEA